MTFEQFAARLEAMAVRTPAACEEIVASVVALAVERAHSFIGQENPGWDPLAAPTLARKTRRGQTGRVSGTDPLYATGELRDSIEGSVQGLTGVVGSTSREMVWHEFGAHPGHGATLPPRPVIGPAMMQATDSPEMDAFVRAAIISVFAE